MKYLFSLKPKPVIIHTAAGRSLYVAHLGWFWRLVYRLWGKSGQ